MRTILLEPDALVLEHRVAAGAALRLEDGLVKEILFSAAPRPQARKISGTLLPGLIDLQVNGAAGHSVDETEPAALDEIARQVRAGGAVAFLPTLITAPFERLEQQLTALAAWTMSYRGDGARPLGIHLEGPFLEQAGAHDASCFLDPTPERISALLAAAKGQLRLLTLAPGRPGAADAIARLRRAGVAVALGHGTASESLRPCVEQGATLVTHLFNAMGPMHHRSPGLAGLALDEPRLACSVIPDGNHVHPAVLRHAWRTLGPERMVLVTDSVAAAGMPDGEYLLQGRSLHLRDGVVRDAEGVLAGSALTMAKAARAFLEMIPGVGPWTLARIAAANPARLLGATELGHIAEGKRAAFCVLARDGEISALSL